MRDTSEQVAERVRQLLQQRAGDTADDGCGSDFGNDFGSDLTGSIGDDLDDDFDDGGAAGNAGNVDSVGGLFGAGFGGRAAGGFGAGPPLPPATVGRHGPPRAGWRELVARVGESLPVRLDPGRGAALAVGVAVLLAALVTGGWVLLQRPASVPVAASAASPSGSAGLGLTATPVGTGLAAPVPASSPAAASPSGDEVVVDVAGKVHRAGLYRLPPGSRIDDAVQAAGGQLRGVDLSSLNLAQKLVDGQQIVVGAAAGAPAASSGVPASGSPPAAGGSAGAGAPVNLNTATIDQLQTLPGIGPVLAQHIIDWRTEHGSFASVAQLDDVSGIGTVKFAALQPLVTV